MGAAGAAVVGGAVSATLHLPPPSEKAVQAALFDWIDLLQIDHPTLGRIRVGEFAYAIPNGSYLAGNPAQRARLANALRAQGLRPGIPDFAIALPVAPYHGLYVELKRDDKASIQPNQRDWQAKLRLAGYKAEIACGFDQARECVQRYLAGAA